MSSRSLRSVPSGLGENAVADRKVRSRRRWPEGIERARGAGVPGASRPAAAQREAPTEGLRSRGGHGWGSMRDCGGNRKEPVRIGVESLTSAVYASALRALCVLARGVSALRAGLGPTGTLAGASPTPQILLNPLLAVRVV